MSAPGALPLSDKPSRGGELIGVSMFLTVWGTLFLAARIYTRVFQTRSFGWDDGFLIGAWASPRAQSQFTLLIELRWRDGLVKHLRSSKYNTAKASRSITHSPKRHSISLRI